MHEIPYTLSNLRKYITYSDLKKLKKLNDYQAKTEIAQATLERIQTANVFADSLSKTVIGGKDGYTFNSAEASASAHLIAKNIRANYPIKQSNRQALIENSVSMLKESTPYNIYRYDIKRFFESIDRKLLLEKLIKDGLCSWQTIILIDKTFELFEVLEIEGVPRGITLSSTLSELTLLDFDTAIKRIDGVFFYGRFVDDILIITSNRILKGEFDKVIESHLPTGLELHSASKRDHFTIRKITSNDNDDRPHTLNYLGYKISVFNKHSDETTCSHARRQVSIDIAESKIQRLKNKTMRAFISYIASNRRQSDYSLLKNRIKSLTGNYYISDPVTGIKIKTGIFFNYAHKNTKENCSLTELDRFLRSLLFSTKSPLSKRIAAALPTNKRRELAELNFTDGFTKARFHSFNYKLLNKMKGVWR